MSFRLKTILGIAAIEAVLLALLVISGLGWLQDSNQEQLLQRGTITARLFATMTKDAVLATDLATLDSFVQEALANPGVVYARVRDAYGQVLAEGGSAEALARDFSPDADPSGHGDGVFDIFTDIKEAGTSFGRVEVGLSVADFQALLGEARAKGSGIALLEIGLVALFSFMLGSYLTRQLRQLRDAARRVADEGPGFHISVRGRDELAQTITAFNDMSSRLAQSSAEQQRMLEELRHQIGERRRAEAELRLTAQAFETQEAILITDNQTRILHVNRAFTRITGYAPEEAMGQTPRLLSSGRQHHDFYRQLWTQLLTKGYWEGEMENRRKNGDIYPEWISISALRDPQGEITHFVAHFTDITERKRVEKALDEARRRAELASEAKSRFLATMSHEIRTPLNAIINLNDLLLETELNSEQSGYVMAASEAGRSLLSIVNSVLDFSKIEAGRVELHPVPCDPEEIAATVARLLAARAFAKGIELTLFVDPRVGRGFSTDPGLLRQILLNLVGNAIKFTEQGGVRLRIHYENEGLDGPSLRFDIIDTGIGIPEGRQADLFVEFSQLDSSRTRRYGGTGLGLAISRSLAHLLGGDLGCDSKPGEGSRFWLRLPAGDMELADVPPPGLFEVLGKRMILIQSGNPILAQEITAQLLSLGLRAQVSLKIPGARKWLADPGCAGCVALVDEDAASLGVGEPGAQSRHLIRLLRSGQMEAVVDGGAGIILDGRIPLSPRGLVRLLADAAGVKLATSLPAESLMTRRQEQPGPSTGQRLPILLVEDSPANRQVALALLSKAGYQADIAENGLQAVTAVKRKPYGLVLMDVAMPEMDGLEATRAIRLLPGDNGRVPIVAMTAGAFTEDKRRCLEAGMNDYLSKPVVRADLLGMLERWLGGVATAAPEAEARPDPASLLDESILAKLEEDVGADLLPGMVMTFVNEVRRRLPNLEGALERRDLGALAHEAHALKGSAGTFGASALGAEALALEQAAKSDNWDRVLTQLPTLVALARQTLDLMGQRFGTQDKDQTLDPPAD
jgi:PAS domain S-box-containing protein